MSYNITTEDLRSIKTKKALYSAMFTLLKKHSFKQITVKGICEEALISRAAFYTHFIDKYDLLKHWMDELWIKNFNKNVTYEQLEKTINKHIHDNMFILKKLDFDSDSETWNILFEFILSVINLTVDKNDNNEKNTENIVLSNFYAGGIVTYLLWLIKNNFPSDIPPMNKYIFKMISSFQDYNKKNDKIGGEH